jgi:alkanesulfonate monooxygenase SsuD/methylene tetrahydromethanopterin reductase-like flavin-dependent oxidoreductase (luciferase family)
MDWAREDSDLLREDPMTESNKRPLKVGICLPTMEEWLGGRTPRWSDMKAFAQHVEASGFDSLWVNDHLLFRIDGLDGPAHGIWDGWSIVTALAATTTRIELGTIVLCTSFRNPALTAKSADTIDEISGGRLILGLGAGWHEPEYKAFGYPYENLVSRFEEALKIIHPLLRTGAVDFRGTYYAAEQCQLLPRGPRAKGPPIMIGARADRPRALRLTAQYADYWHRFYNPETLPDTLATLDAACLKAGRDPATLQRTVTLVVNVTGVSSEPSGEWIRRISSTLGVPSSGEPEQLASLLRSLAAQGIGHVQLMLEPNTMAAVDSLRPMLELLDQG